MLQPHARCSKTVQRHSLSVSKTEISQSFRGPILSPFSGLYFHFGLQFGSLTSLMIQSCENVGTQSLCAAKIDVFVGPWKGTIFYDQGQISRPHFQNCEQRKKRIDFYYFGVD